MSPGCEGYVLAMSVTGPCPDTRTHLSWKLFNICKGLWERTTCSGAIYTERERGHVTVFIQSQHSHTNLIIFYDMQNKTQ